MTDSPMSPVLRLAILALAAAPSMALGQSRRLELSDTARAPLRQPATRAMPAAPAPLPTLARPAQAGFGNPFVRDQTALGALVYAPAFALTMSRDAVPAVAAYVVVGAGTYFVASQLTRDMNINGTTSALATMSALHGAVAGWALAHAFGADRRATAGGVFFGSVGATTAVLALGRGLSEGEASSTIFGTQFFAASTFALASAGGNDRAAGAAAVGAGLIGVPLGYWYAHRAAYRVTSGDVTALWTSAAIGAAAAGTTVAGGGATRPAVTAALVGGAVLGAIAGDRFLVRRFDHSPSEGQLVALGAAGGGLMGAGVGMLVGAAHDRMSPATVAFTTAGALAGLVLTERWLAPRADDGRRTGRLAVTPAALVGVASHQRGTYSLLRWTF